MHVVAEMVASVHSLEARIGDHVAIGDTLLVLESMKMENPVISPVSGVVSEINIEPEQVVAQGVTLAVIDY